MKKIFFLGLVLIGIIIISGCEGGIDVSKLSDEDLSRISEKLIVCNKPYMRYGSSCCLDKEDNQICDRDERQLTDEEKEAEEEITIQEKPSETQSIKEEKKEEVKVEYIPPPGIDLSDYPSFFIKNNKFDGITVIGDNAAAETVIGVSDIVMSLQYYGVGDSNTKIEKIEVGSTKLASEIGDITSQNILSVGSACENQVTWKIMGSHSDCNTGFREGKGLIQLFDTGEGKVALIVGGYTPIDTRAATVIVADYSKNALSGTKIEVDTATMGVTRVG